MNGSLDECHIIFRNFCDKNKSHSKMFGLLDYWMIRLKPALKKSSSYLLGLLDEWIIV